MKRLSTVKRLLALVCALVMALGVGLQGNVVTVRAEAPPEEEVVDLDEAFAQAIASIPEEQWNAIVELFEILGTKTQEELDEYIRDNEDHFLELMIAAAGDELTTEDIAQIKAGLDAMILAKFGPSEPPKTPEEIAIEKIEKDLSFYHPLIQMTGTPILMVNLGEWHNLGNKVMQKIAKKVSDGYNVALFMRYEKKPLFVLIPAGSTVDLSLDWYGPLCLSELYENITEEYLAQDKSLSKFLKLKNILDARAVAAAAE